MRLTRDEIILVSSILVALVVGALVQHYRESARVEAIERNLKAAKAGDSARKLRAE